jgi:phosphatidylglycerol:prolipoprotein diacylglycerol transferase
VTFLAHWIHDLSPFLVRFGDNFGIRWYGLGYVAGFVAAGWLFRRYHRAGRTPLTPQASLDLMTALVAGVLVGGRLGYFLLYQPGALLHDPLILLRVWEGGMASHGGFLGVTLALVWFARNRRLDYRHIGDLVVTAAPPGLFFVRVANFINGELWGKVSDVPWAVIFSNTGGGPLPRHPSQLYEAALEGLLLLAVMQWRFWQTDLPQHRPGRLAGEFLIGYALARAFCEIFREPDEGVSLILGLSRGTFYSFFLIAGGLALIALSRRPVAAR